jgi:hypothetical protein
MKHKHLHKMLGALSLYETWFVSKEEVKKPSFGKVV